MTPTCFGCIANPFFHEDHPYAPSGIPSGNLLEVSCNPYNGQIVVSFQRSDAALDLIEFFLDSLEFNFGAFRNFAEPIIEGESRYVLRAVV